VLKVSVGHCGGPWDNHIRMPIIIMIPPKKGGTSLNQPSSAKTWVLVGVSSLERGRWVQVI
jgi:hypothetical protein